MLGWVGLQNLQADAIWEATPPLCLRVLPGLHLQGNSDPGPREQAVVFEVPVTRPGPHCPTPFASAPEQTSSSPPWTTWPAGAVPTTLMLTKQQTLMGTTTASRTETWLCRPLRPGPAAPEASLARVRLFCPEGQTSVTPCPACCLVTGLRGPREAAGGVSRTWDTGGTVGMRQQKEVSLKPECFPRSPKEELFVPWVGRESSPTVGLGPWRGLQGWSRCQPA